MTEEVIRAERVNAGYGMVPVLRDFNLTLRAGEVTALLGPNGAGKTTALLSLVGLLPCSQGQITAQGERVTTRNTSKLAQAGIVLVPDDRGVIPDLTVAEHFRIAATRSVRKARTDMVLDRFPALRDLMPRKAGLLSGGEQQMLAIGKALLCGPKALMVDEMSLGLAPVIVQEMIPRIRSLAKEEGIAVLLVEQHVAIALSVSDRALVLNQGRIVLEGDAMAMISDPGKVEAAYFGH